MINSPPVIRMMRRYPAKRPPRKLAERPSETKTTEKPMMKATALSTTRRRTRLSLDGSAISSIDTPEMNERYDGITGSTHGDKNESSPELKATKKLMSVIACRRGDPGSPAWRRDRPTAPDPRSERAPRLSGL